MKISFGRVVDMGWRGDWQAEVRIPVSAEFHTIYCVFTMGPETVIKVHMSFSGQKTRQSPSSQGFPTHPPTVFFFKREQYMQGIFLVLFCCLGSCTLDYVGLWMETFQGKSKGQDDQGENLI